MCVYTGRQADSYQAPTPPRQVTQVLLTVCCRHLYVVNCHQKKKVLLQMNKVFEKMTALLSPLVCLNLSECCMQHTCAAAVVEDTLCGRISNRIQTYTCQKKKCVSENLQTEDTNN